MSERKVTSLNPAPDPAPDDDANFTITDFGHPMFTTKCIAADDPAPDDAEFEQLVRDYGTSAWDYGDGGSTTAKELEDELQRILALHRQAKHAGLRELRDDLAEYGALNDHPTQWDEGFVAFQELALDKIDDLLTEATDDR
jgi:hypothetical protein